MKPKHQLVTLALTASLLPISTQADPINWSAPSVVSGDSDVYTNGAYKYAYIVGLGSAYTINGVSFAASTNTSNLGGGNVTISGLSNQYTGFGSGSAPFSSLTPNYQNLLRSGFYAGSGTATINLNNLTSDHKYATQFWVNDSRSAALAARSLVLSSAGGNSATLDYGTPTATGGVGQYAVGTFMADSATQAFTSKGNVSTQMNGIQVRDITNLGYWTGINGASWDASTTANFASNNFDAALVNATFDVAKAPLGSVTFADDYWNSNTATAVTQNTVTIAAGGVSTGAVDFYNDTVDYTISSSDVGITGSTAVNLNGAATVTLLGTHTYTGGTIISDGTLRIGNGGTTGSIAGPIVVDAGGTLKIDRSNGYSLSNVMTGSGTLILKGDGWSDNLNFSGDKSGYSGNVIVEGVRMRVQGSEFGTGVATVKDTGQIWVENGTVSNNLELNGNGTTEGSGNLGAVRLGNNSVLSGAITLQSNSRLTVWGGSDKATVTGVISGSGALEKTGSGTLTLSGSSPNTYTGDTRVNEGVVVLSKTTGPAIGGNLIFDNNLSPDVYATKDNQFGAGAVVQFVNNTGDHGRLDLMGTTQTVAGIESVAGGRGVIQHRESSPSGSVVDTTSTLILNGSGNYTYRGYLRNQTGGIVELIKNGSGTQTLSGSNIIYTGDTTINSGEIQLASANVGRGDWTINNGGILRGTATDSINGINSITVNAGGKLIQSGGNYQQLHGGSSGVGLILNGGSVEATVAGHSRYGNFLLRGNMVVGGTQTSTISADFRMGDNATRTITVNNTGDASGIDLDITGRFSHFNNVTWGYMIKEGAGTMRFASTSNNDVAKLTLNAGKVIMVDQMNGWRNGGVVNNAEFEADISGGLNKVYGGGNLTGTGTFTKSGAGTLQFRRGNQVIRQGQFNLTGGKLQNNGNSVNWSTNTGDMNISAGATLDLFADGVTVGGLNGGGTITNGYGNNGSAEILTVGAGNKSGSFAGIITQTGSGAVSGAGVGNGAVRVVKTGTGTQIFTGANSYKGLTSVEGGVLKLQGGAFSTTARAYDIDTGTTLNLDGNTGVATGTTTLGGGGTLLVTGGTFGNESPNLPKGSGRNIALELDSGALIDIDAGAKMINGGWANTTWTNNLADLNVDGELDLWDGKTAEVDALSGTGRITANPGSTGTQTLVVGKDDGGDEFSGRIQDANRKVSITKVGSGTQTLSGTRIDYTGATTVEDDGTLRFLELDDLHSSKLTISTDATAEFENSTRTFNRFSATSIEGDGTFLKTGTGLLKTGNASNRYARWNMTGGLIDIQGGEFRTDYQNQSVAWVNNKASMNVATGATVSMVGGNHISVDALTGGGIVQNINNWGTGIFTVGTNDGGDTFTGTMRDNGGPLALTKIGTGTQTLTGANTYTGTTTISAGTLQIGNGGTSGSLGTGDVTNNAALVFDRSDTHTVTNKISGTGTLTKNGSGTTNLTGTNTYTGKTTVTDGTLALIGTGSIANSVEIELMGATIDVSAVTGGFTLENGQTLSGVGSVNGPIQLAAGSTIAPGMSPGTLTMNSSMMMFPGSTLEIELSGGNQTIGSNINDLITGVTDLTLDGIIDVSETTALPGDVFLGNVQRLDRWVVIEYTGDLTDNGIALGSVPTMQPWMSLKIDLSVAGQVALVAVPEPSSALLIVLGGIGFVFRRRK